MKNGNEWPQSTKPSRTNPPDGSVGIVIPMRDNLKFFKLTYHSILDFTDYRYMLTVVDNMSTFSTRQYLDSIRRNHNVNILSYQKEHDLNAEVDLALQFMFAFEQVKYGCVVLPDMVVEPNWLSRMVNELNESGQKTLRAAQNEGTDSGLMLFKRDAIEPGHGFKALAGMPGSVVAHRMTRTPVKESLPSAVDA